MYRATVVFELGRHLEATSVDDGFTATHRFPAVEIGKSGKQAAAEPVALANTAAATPPSAGDDGPDLLLALGGRRRRGARGRTRRRVRSSGGAEGRAPAGG